MCKNLNELNECVYLSVCECEFMNLRVCECVCELCVNVRLFLEGVDGTQGSRRSVLSFSSRPQSNPGNPPQMFWGDPGSWEAQLAPGVYSEGYVVFPILERA